MPASEGDHAASSCWTKSVCLLRDRASKHITSGHEGATKRQVDCPLAPHLGHQQTQPLTPRNLVSGRNKGGFQCPSLKPGEGHQVRGVERGRKYRPVRQCRG